MAVTRLDPNSALIVVDMQNAIVAMATVTPAQLAVQHAGELAAAFRSRDLPVVLVSAAGQPPGRTERPIRHDTPLPENPMALAAGLNQQPGDHLVVKRSRSAFAGTGLTQYLRELGATAGLISMDRKGCSAALAVVPSTVTGNRGNHGQD